MLKKIIFLFILLTCNSNSFASINNKYQLEESQPSSSKLETSLMPGISFNSYYDNFDLNNPKVKTISFYSSYYKLKANIEFYSQQNYKEVKSLVKLLNDNQVLTNEPILKTDSGLDSSLIKVFFQKKAESDGSIK